MDKALKFASSSSPLTIQVGVDLDAMIEKLGFRKTLLSIVAYPNLLKKMIESPDLVFCVDDALNEAIEAGNQHSIDMLIDHASDWTRAARTAIRVGNLRVVKLLFKRGVDKDAALEYLKCNHLGVIKFLLQKTKASELILKAAIVGHSEECLRYLLDRKLDVDPILLLQAAILVNDKSLVEELVENYSHDIHVIRYAGRIGSQDIISLVSEDGRDLGIVAEGAAQAGNIELLKALETRFDLNKVLAQAIVSKQLEVVQYVTSRPDFKLSKHCSLVLRKGSYEIVRHLVTLFPELAAGEICTIQKVDDIVFFLITRPNFVAWESLLKYGAEFDNLEYVKLAIDRGADINLAFKPAMKAGNLSIVCYLLDQGIKAYDKGLCMAVEEGNIDLVRLMLDRGAVDLTSALYTAAERNNIAMAKFLISKGATERRAAMLIATKNNFTDMVTVLADETSTWSMLFKEACKVGNLRLVKLYVQKAGFKRDEALALAEAAEAPYGIGMYL